MGRTDPFGKTLMLGKIEGRRTRGRQRMRWLDGITDSMDMSLSPGVGHGQGGLAFCSPWGHKELDMIELLNWTELSIDWACFSYCPYCKAIGLMSCIVQEASWMKGACSRMPGLGVCHCFLCYFSVLSTWQMATFQWVCKCGGPGRCIYRLCHLTLTKHHHKMANSLKRCLQRTHRLKIILIIQLQTSWKLQSWNSLSSKYKMFIGHLTEPKQGSSDETW